MFPKLFVDRIQHQFANADELLKALNMPMATSIRKHPIKGIHASLKLDQEIAWCPNSYYLAERPSFTLDPVFHAGAYYVQESSSMFLWKIFDSLFYDKNMKILDLCAAPGGKSTLIASWLNGEGLLLSNEVIKTRASILLENITKWGYANNWVTSTDAYVLGGLNEFFDCIVLDAPCSGEGLFRKDKSAIEEWSEANCDLCAGRQRKIVAEILPALQVGGYIIYSTCTFNPAENDENIKWMMKEFPLELVTVNTDSFPEVSATNVVGYAFYPHLVKGEGFYCCILKKIGEVDITENIRHQKIKFEKLVSKNIDFEKYLSPADSFYFTTIQQKMVGIPIHLIKAFEEISSVTKISGGYLSIGEMKGKDLVPEHSLAMSIYYHHAFTKVEVDRQQALNYLARKDFKAETKEPGWSTITYNQLPLGFAKVLPNRINNYYPQEWRIRMEVG
jgi:16S rRNA C967 or C1407 C5-methylase (RsmB/RsmF family)/NOL1/NOP2/fmu family ribosome biogenesis protein